MPDAYELLYSNLHEVLSERDPELRRAAIERTYTEDVIFPATALVRGLASAARSAFAVALGPVSGAAAGGMRHHRE